MSDRKRVIRAKTFRGWFKANLMQQAGDIASHGADAGYPCITYTNDCARIFDRFDAEIWEMMSQDAEDMGEKNVAAFIATFRRADMSDDIYSFKNLCLWYACEKVAREIADAKEAA